MVSKTQPKPASALASSPLAALTVCVVFILLNTLNSFSQISRYDNWQSYSSMFNVQVVEVDDYGDYWVGTSGGLYIYSQDTEDFTYLRGPEQLLGNDITALKWDPDISSMIVGFGDGNINIVGYDGSAVLEIVSNVDISNSDISQPRIQDIELSGGRAYVIGAFGMATLEVGDNFFIEDTKKFATLPVATPANDILIVDNTIYVATAKGVVRVGIEESLADPSKWDLIKFDDTLEESFEFLAEVGGVVFASNSESILRVESDTLINSDLDLSSAQFGMTASGGEIFVLDSFAIRSAFTDKVFPYDGLLHNTLYYHQEKLLLGTQRNSLVVFDVNTGDTTMITPRTPSANFVKKIYIDDINNEVYYTTGSLGAAGVQRLTADGWEVYNSRTVEPLIDAVSGDKIRFPDAITEDVERIGDKLFLCSFGAGIIQIDLNSDSIVEYYGKDNTSISEFLGESILATDLEMDQEGVLWVTLPGENVRGTLTAYYDEAADTWVGMEEASANDRWSNVMEIDNFGNKWFGGYINNTRGIVYFNEKSVDDPSDDVWGSFNKSQQGLLLSNIHSDLEMDQSGNLWISTDNGLTVLLNPGSVVNGNNPVLVEKTEFVNFPVTCLAIDAVNNMWVGTSQGISIYGPDGEEIIATINADNSALLNNNITDIEIAKNGTIYIGTEQGLYSVNSSFTEPLDGYELDIFPQPFQPRTHDGMTISGLAPDTDIRIMTPGGVFINSFKTKSGSFIWNGRDSNNRIAEPGVYILIATSESTENATVQKFAVVNQ